MKKILMIVQNDFVNDSRIIKEANSLGKNGFEVKVLALHNNGLKENEDFEYFSVKRIKLSTREKLGKNKISQIFKYLEFKNKCTREAIIFKPNYIHCHDIYTLPIGEKILKKIKNKNVKFVYDSHELWSEASNNITMPPILLKMQNNLENKIIRQCDEVITVSKSIVKHLKDKYNLNKQPILIRNIPYQHKNVNSEKLFHKKFNLDYNKRIVIYQGAVAKGRGIEPLMEAMKYTNDNIVLVILGNGAMVEKYKKMRDNINLKDKIYFHEAVSPNELISYTSSADLGISLVKNICLSYYYALPNKMFEYIQAEIPVICSNYPDMQDIVKTYKVGETTEPDDSEKMANEINKILSDTNVYEEYVKNCKYAKEQLNWEEESKKLINLYNML